MENKFKWVTISNQIAKSILRYKNTDEELMNIIQLAKQEINKKSETKSGEKIKDIDGFSAMNILFTRLENDNKDKFLINILKKMNEEINIPKGEYTGIPKIHYNHVRITNGVDDEKILKKFLWDLFESCLKYADQPNDINEKEFIKNYNKAINEHEKLNGKLSKHFIKSLTVSMFLCCPNVYVPLDINTLIEISKITKKKNIEDFETGESYVNLIKDIKKYITEHSENYKTIYELSEYAYLTNSRKDYKIYSAGSGDKKEGNRERFFKNHYYTINWAELGDLREYVNEKKQVNEERLNNKINQLNYKNGKKDCKKSVTNFINLEKGNILILKTGVGNHGKYNEATIYAIGIVEKSFENGYKYIDNKFHSIPVKWVKIFKKPVFIKEIQLNGTLNEISKTNNIEKIIETIGEDVMQDVLEKIETTEEDVIQDVLKQSEEMSDELYDKNIILYGPPGTGKTYNSIIYAVAICNNKSIQEIENNAKQKAQEDNKDYYEIIKEEFDKLKDEKRIAFTTFHQSYSYEDFIEGIKPDIKKSVSSDNKIVYKYEDGIFKEFCLNIKKQNEIEKNHNKKYVFIIDEINRGNISKIFGELITLIETSKRENEKEEIKAILPYTKDEFCVPNNIYILGTMNTADRSIALMDTALRRRFSFVEMLPDPEKLDIINIDGQEINLKTMLDKINQRIEILYDREHTIGHAFFMKLMKKEEPTIEDLKTIFRQKIIPLLQEYFYDDYSKIRLVLGNDFIVKNDKSDNDIFKQSILNETNIQIDNLLENQYIINEGSKNNDVFKDINNYKKIYEKDGENK